MITSQGRYEPSAGARISLWPVEPITADAIATETDTTLILHLGSMDVLLYQQDAASLEVLGHALIRLAEEQRRETAKRDLEPLQEK